MAAPDPPLRRYHRVKGNRPARIISILYVVADLKLQLLHPGLTGYPLSYRAELLGVRVARTVAVGMRGGAVEFGRNFGRLSRPR